MKGGEFEKIAEITVRHLLDAMTIDAAPGEQFGSVTVSVTFNGDEAIEKIMAECKAVGIEHPELRGGVEKVVATEANNIRQAVLSGNVALEVLAG